MGNVSKVSKAAEAHSSAIQDVVCRKVCDVGVKEASDVVALTGHRFVVVGDQSKSLSLIDEDHDITRLKLEGLESSSGLEAVAFDPAREHLFVVNEEKNILYRYEMEFEPELTATLERTFDLSKWDGKNKNKGVEGMASVPESASPTGKPILLIAKEGEPKELAYVDDGGGSKTKAIQIDPKLDELVSDFSGVACHPTDGRLFITSEESSMLCVCRLVEVDGEIVCKLEQAFNLVNHNGHALKRVEGVCCDEDGEVYVLLEDKCILMHVEL